MKDKVARGMINALKGQVEGLFEEIGKLEECSEECHLKDVSVRACPVCKHETPQKVGVRLKGIPLSGFVIAYGTDYDFDYLCLTCGSKLVCETKTECKALKEEEK